MFKELPTEILYIIFNDLETSSDHVQFSRICHSTWSISQHKNLRNKLLRKFFDTKENHTAVPNDIYLELCHLIEASNVKPKSNQMLQVLEEQIETSHFVTFGYTNIQVKAKILDLFRPKCQKIKDKLMNIDNRTMTTMRQLTSSGPRRIYYDITIPYEKHEKFFKCVFYDLHKVTAFDESYTAHEGTMQFQDENIVSDMSWRSIFKATVDEPQHVILPGQEQGNQNSPGCGPVQKHIVPDTRQLTLNKIPKDWKPCLLHAYYDCTLLAPIKKGGLTQYKKFEYVFVYENKHDDSICIEFCSKDNNRVTPRGYLLMKEHLIQWNA